MIEFIDYEKRLNCEEHLALYYYMCFKINKQIQYKQFNITESLINEYNEAKYQDKEKVDLYIRQHAEKIEGFRRKYNSKIWEYEKPVIWSDRNKTQYFINQLIQSHKFEVYIDSVFRKYNVDIGLYYGKSQQYYEGETEKGIEIKRDMKLAETGNVYIEYQERLRNSQNWVNSGILKEDRTKYFLIGDIGKYFIFKRNILLSYYEKLVIKGQNITGASIKREKQHQTSKGFVLNENICRSCSISVQDVVNEIKGENK